MLVTWVTHLTVGVTHALPEILPMIPGTCVSYPSALVVVRFCYHRCNPWGVTRVAMPLSNSTLSVVTPCVTFQVTPSPSHFVSSYPIMAGHMVMHAQSLPSVPCKKHHCAVGQLFCWPQALLLHSLAKSPRHGAATRPTQCPPQMLHCPLVLATQPPTRPAVPVAARHPQWLEGGRSAGYTSDTIPAGTPARTPAGAPFGAGSTAWNHAGPPLPALEAPFSGPFQRTLPALEPLPAPFWHPSSRPFQRRNPFKHPFERPSGNPPPEHPFSLKL